MFAARRQLQRRLTTSLTKRTFGGDVGEHHATHNPPRMVFEEWKSLNDKLKIGDLKPAEVNNIRARFTEARLTELEQRAFQERLTVEKMSQEEFDQKVMELTTSRWAKDYPKLSKYQLSCLRAHRAGQKEPDLYELVLPKDFTPWTPAELGKGNAHQKQLNEYMYEMQNCPERHNKLFGGLGLDQLNSQTVQTQSLIWFWAAVVAAVYGANLYRNMYIEKYSLWDMLNWETRVVCARAEKERGW